MIFKFLEFFFLNNIIIFFILNIFPIIILNLQTLNLKKNKRKIVNIISNKDKLFNEDLKILKKIMKIYIKEY